MSDNTPTWTLNPRVRYRRVFDEGVLVHQERAEALVLNDTALAFLDLCDGRRDLDAILQAMLEQYDIDEATLRADLETFVKELAGEGVIEAA